MVHPVLKVLEAAAEGVLELAEKSLNKTVRLRMARCCHPLVRADHGHLYISTSNAGRLVLEEIGHVCVRRLINGQLLEERPRSRRGHLDRDRSCGDRKSNGINTGEGVCYDVVGAAYVGDLEDILGDERDLAGLAAGAVVGYGVEDGQQLLMVYPDRQRVAAAGMEVFDRQEYRQEFPQTLNSSSQPRKKARGFHCWS